MTAATAEETRTSKKKEGKMGGAGDATLEAAFARADKKSEEIQELERGAGDGQFAVATRVRDYDQDPVEAPIEQTEWPEGDVDKGRLDPEANAPSGGQIIAHRDRRAYLLNQAQQNEAANDELNFIQTEQNKKLGIVTGIIQDPDFQRESSMVSAVADLKMHDREAFMEGREDRRAMREEKRRERMGLPPEDAKARKAAGHFDPLNKSQPSGKAPDANVNAGKHAHSDK